jgi:hypothetical protein
MKSMLKIKDWKKGRAPQFKVLGRGFGNSKEPITVQRIKDGTLFTIGLCYGAMIEKFCADLIHIQIGVVVKYSDGEHLIQREIPINSFTESVISRIRDI